MGYRWGSNVIVADGKSWTLTNHSVGQIEERGIRITWVVNVLENWVARRWNDRRQSMNYWGHVEGRSQLLMVAVSADDERIVTVYFDTRGTERYDRHTRGQADFFDEVRDVPNSQV